MSFTPTQLDPIPKHRSGDDFSYSFQFVEDSSPVDLSAQDDVVVKLYNNSGAVFEHSSADGDNVISSSSGTDNDIISGTVSGATMTLDARRYYLDVYFMLDGKKTTYVSSLFNIVGSAKAGTANEWLVTITNSTDSATGKRATNILALALDALSQLSSPTGIILVDGQFTNNSDIRYDDIDLAITAARARLADDWDKAVIKAYLDSSGVPIGLGDNDYYELQDEGIYFESEFDPVNRLIKGGNFDIEELLYTYDLEETNINLNF